jgi:raffinose/stachyose/melibiose transport system substrate-binding protein
MTGNAKTYLAILAIALLFGSPTWAGGSQETGQQNLVVWLSGEPGTVNVYTELLEEFAEAREGLSVEVLFIGSDLFNPTLVPALSSGDGPDVFQFGTGPGQPAAIIQGRLVQDLTDYYFEFGWDQVIPKEVVSQTSSDGKLWAVGDEVETTMMFYNREIFARLGLQVPETMDELHTIAQTLQAEGYSTPIGLGGADRWPISHWQSMAFGRFAGPAGIDRVMFGDGRWDSEEFVAASAFIQDLADRGYFGNNPNAVGYAEVMDAFWAGDIPMTYTGPWVIGDAIRALGDEIQNFGVFMLPPLGPGQSIYPTESIGSGWYISAASASPDLAAEMVNHVFFRKESRIRLLNSGETIPVGPIEELLPDVELPVLREQMLEAVDRYRGNGTVPAFLDTVQPARTTEAVYNGLQALVAGRVSPQQFVRDIQRAWERDKSEGLILEPGGVDRR